MTADPQSPTAYLEERPVLSPRRARLVSWSIPLLLAFPCVWLAGSDTLDDLEGTTIDWRFSLRGPRRPPANVVIVEIDESSRRGLTDGVQAFNLREHLAPVIENLWNAQALVIGLDIWLEGETTPQVDDRLYEVLAEANVVLAVAHTDGRLKRAAARFLETGPAEGVITVYPDAGGNVLRRLPPRLYLDILRPGAGAAEVERIPHFPLMLAWFAIPEDQAGDQLRFEDNAAVLGEYRVRPGELIDFATLGRSDDEGPRFTTLSFEDVARGTFDVADVEGAIVLVGEARNLGDLFVMPLSHELVPGVYYHANAVAHCLEQRRFDESWTQGSRRAWLTFVLALAAGLFAWNQRQWWRHRYSSLLLIAYLVFGVALFLGGWTVLSVWAFGRGTVLPMVGPLTAMAAALGIGLAAQWVLLSSNAKRLDQRARRIESLFGQSVSTDVLEALKQHPERIARTELREVSVLFCDLRGFTAMTSTMSPVDVAEMLNEYFNHITPAVFEHDGFIDKFVGDEVMAVFSVPFDQSDHVERAVRTAIDIKGRLAKLNQLREARDQPMLNCGLGIHCGPAAAGHIGSQRRSNYTVVGTTVNLAARIEHFTSSGEILVSEAVRAVLPASIAVRPWKRVEIKGAQGEHKLFEVLTDNPVSV